MNSKNSFVCPYCNQTIAIFIGTSRTHTVSFSSSAGHAYNSDAYDPSAVNVTFFRCPNCKEYTVTVRGVGESVVGYNCTLKPASLAKHFPEYVPAVIRSDYEEAFAIAELSPKASATLSRRCLQAMIRDFWGISKNRLVDAIDTLEGKVPAAHWKILHSLRHLGNIGAHPDADVNHIIDIDPGDAIKLLKVIELLIQQWYIERHEQQELFREIDLLDESTQAERKKQG